MEHDYGEGIRTPKGEVYFLLRPTLGEYTRRLKRQTQIVFPKEAGFIIEHLNIFPGCTVVECGTGSGSLCCTFAHFVGETGKVCTYDRREEFSALARKNAEKWGVAHRIEFNVRSLDRSHRNAARTPYSSTCRRRGTISTRPMRRSPRETTWGYLCRRRIRYPRRCARAAGIRLRRRAGGRDNAPLFQDGAEPHPPRGYDDRTYRLSHLRRQDAATAGDKTGGDCGNGGRKRRALR